MYALIIVSVAGSGYLISSGGYDHKTLESCRSEFQNLLTDDVRTGKIQTQYFCENETTHLRVKLFDTIYKNILAE